MSREANQIILASTSPRRREIMSWLGKPYLVVPSRVDEAAFEHLAPREKAITLARMKAELVARETDGAVVIGADTVVELDGIDLGKPANEDDAIRMLRRLSGRTHRVITGVAVHQRGRALTNAMATEVSMRGILESEIREYVATGEPMDKAGAYALQGLARRFVEMVEGCRLNVVGFPVCIVDSLVKGFEDELPPASIELCRRTWTEMVEGEVFDSPQAVGPP